MSSKTRMPVKHREVAKDSYERIRKHCISRLSEKRQELIDRKRHGDNDEDHKMKDTELGSDVNSVLQDALSKEMSDFGERPSQEQIDSIYLELMIMFEQEIQQQQHLEESQQHLEDNERFDEEYLQYMISLQRP